MARRNYGQFCGIARALEIVGERWAMLIVRDLVIGPKRFTDLQHGLPRISTNVLSARLKELEHAGVVHRRVLPRPSAAVVYELTEYGGELDDILMRLGRWGARSLQEPEPEDVVTVDSLAMALRSTFRPEAALGLNASYELRVGSTVVHARLDDGDLVVGTGPLSDADLVIETDIASIPVMTDQVRAAQAVGDKSIRLTGAPGLLDRFVAAFGSEGPRNSP